MANNPGPGPSGSELSAQPNATEVRLSPNDPLLSWRPRDAINGNVTVANPLERGFSVKDPPALDRSASSGLPPKAPFYATMDAPNFLQKGVKLGAAAIEPETQAGNLANPMNVLRQQIRKSRSCSCGNRYDAALTVCPNCSHDVAPPDSTGWSLSPAVIGKVLGLRR